MTTDDEPLEVPDTMPSEDEEPPLGFIVLDYTGPLKNKAQVRNIERAFTAALDGLGLAKISQKGGGVTTGYLQRGILEVRLRIPTDMLEPAADPLAKMTQKIQINHYGAELRRCLQKLFRQWRVQAPKEETS